MGDCLGCPGFVNSNTELEKIRADAKKQASKTGTAQAVFKDYGEYRYCTAEQAFKIGYAIKEIITHAQ